MEYEKIPEVGMEVSRIGLGTWAIGGWKWGGSEERKSIKTIHRALDKGINLIDTAPAYGFGKSEKVVGKAVEEYDGDREDVVIATKVGLKWKDGDTFRNSSRERVLKEIEDSLERLRTDYIDIYQVHWPDTLVPIEETASALKELYDEGKIRAVGVSNYSIEQMKEFQENCPLHTYQPLYNMFERGIEDGRLSYCFENDIHLLTYGALCRGLLSGKITEDIEFEGDDMRKEDDPKFQEPHFSQYLSAVEKLDELAQERFGKDVLHLSVRWILEQGVQTALWGARKPSQIEPVNEVFNFSLNEKDMKNIENILEETIDDPVSEGWFMPPPSRDEI